MYYIEFKNKLHILIVKDTTKYLITKIINYLNKNNYHNIIIEIDNNKIPIPNDYKRLVNYSHKNNINLLFK